MSGKLAKRRPWSLSPWYERGPLSVLRSEMDDLFSRFFGEEGEWFAESRVPTLDVSETDKEIDVTVDLPCMQPKDIDIKVTGNTLSIHGEHQEEEEKKGDGRTFHRVERRGSFFRTVPLPCSIDADRIDANYKDGVLSIALPKTEQSQSRKVKVKG